MTFSRTPMIFKNRKNPRGEMNNQIKHIIINKTFKNAILYCKIYTRDDCVSGQITVICNLRMNLLKFEWVKVALELLTPE